MAVRQGDKVKRGDVLLTIEAMKMETSVRSDRDATVAEVVTKHGETVDAKDLLVVLAVRGVRVSRQARCVARWGRF